MFGHFSTLCMKGFRICIIIKNLHLLVMTITVANNMFKVYDNNRRLTRSMCSMGLTVFTGYFEYAITINMLQGYMWQHSWDIQVSIAMEVSLKDSIRKENTKQIPLIIMSKHKKFRKKQQLYLTEKRLLHYPVND